MFRRRTPRTVDGNAMPLWTRMPDGSGFVRSTGGSFMVRTPLDRILGRPGFEILSCGASFRADLPPGTPLRDALGGFGGLVAGDGVSAVFEPVQAPSAPA